MRTIPVGVFAIAAIGLGAEVLILTAFGTNISTIGIILVGILAILLGTVAAVESVIEEPGVDNTKLNQIIKALIRIQCEIHELQNQPIDEVEEPSAATQIDEILRKLEEEQKAEA
jgi:hypothetical protein